ncbi:MAG TPA: hypothetical protein P5052_00400 [Candidatus Paceibacterota bacterium]|jgi:hypothetical protein|nr:hypothetical protein [Candidatus Paceibacterota bacterium]HRZ29266.1 hypothetical protein [Candidatus Paceibacterota bacterium]
MPKNFPAVAKSINIISRNGNNLIIDAQVKSFGKTFPVKMKTTIIQDQGFISDNESPIIGTSGHEELMLKETEVGTMINYIYQVDIHKPLLRIIAKPLVGWFAMKFWKRAFIDKLKAILEN